LVTGLLILHNRAIIDPFGGYASLFGNIYPPLCHLKNGAIFGHVHSHSHTGGIAKNTGHYWCMVPFNLFKEEDRATFFLAKLGNVTHFKIPIYLCRHSLEFTFFFALCHKISQIVYHYLPVPPLFSRKINYYLF